MNSVSSTKAPFYISSKEDLSQKLLQLVPVLSSFPGLSLMHKISLDINTLAQRKMNALHKKFKYLERSSETQIFDLFSSFALLNTSSRSFHQVRFNNEMESKVKNQCLTLKLMNVTRIGRQPRISGPVVNRANCTKSAAVTSKLKNYPKYKFQKINIQNINSKI